MPRKPPIVIEGATPDIDYDAVRADEEALKNSRPATIEVQPEPLLLGHKPTSMGTPLTLESIFGPIQQVYAGLLPGTMSHVDQLMNERRTNLNLRGQWFNTADGILYFLQGKKPMLAITRGKDNLVLRHLNEAVDSSYDQLVETGNYRPNALEFQQSITAKDTVVIDLTKLRLDHFASYVYYLYISTTKYHKLKPEEQKLAERIYGQGNDFSANMEMLNEAGIKKTRVSLLNPAYVHKNTAQRPLGLTSTLCTFIDDSQFTACIHELDKYAYIRGGGGFSPQVF